MYLRMLVGLVLFGTAIPAHAAPITWEFEGRLEYRQLIGTPDGIESFTATLNSLGVQAGAPISGFIVFESSALDILPEANLARYRGAITHAELRLGGYTLSRNPDPLRTSDIFAGTLLNSGFSVLYPQVSLVDDTGLLDGAFMEIELASQSSEFFTDETRSLPLDPPALSDLEQYVAFAYGTAIYVSLSADGAEAQMYTSISRLERVPEPAVIALIAAAAVALLALRSRRAS